MKQLISWLTGFFDSTNEHSSSKRLVGILGAFSLFYTLISSSRHPLESNGMSTLIWAVVVIICVSLGLASIKDMSELIGKAKGDKNKETSSENVKS